MNDEYSIEHMLKKVEQFRIQNWPDDALLPLAWWVKPPCLHERRQIVDYDDTDPSLDIAECLDCGQEFKVPVASETGEQRAQVRDILAQDADALGLKIEGE